jgi:flagellar hook-length control protein FliK
VSRRESAERARDDDRADAAGGRSGSQRSDRARRNEVTSNDRDGRSVRGDEDRFADTTSHLDRTTASETRDTSRSDTSTSATTNDRTDSVTTNADNSAEQLDASETDGIAASADELAAMAAAEAAARGEVPAMAANLTLFVSGSGASADTAATLETVGGDTGAASGIAATPLNTTLPNTTVTGLPVSASEGTAAQLSTTSTTGANAAASFAAASETAANAAISGAAQAAASNTNNAARRTRAGSTGAAAETAGSPQNAATRAMDPLARLIQSSQDALAAAQSGGANHGADHGTNHGAIAGRLAEVEAGIARDRAQRAIAGTGASLAIDGDASTAGQISGVTESAAEGINTAASTAIGREAAQGSLATGALPNDGSRAGASFSTSAIGAGIAQGPASDLAFASEDSSAPAAQLAAKGAEILAKQRGGAITMRLEPPALGQLKIELRIAHGSVVADFTAATPEARVLLESSMGMLRERLESQGLGVERITVHGGRAHGEAAAAQGSQQGSQQGDARSQGDARGDGSGRQSDGGARQDAAGGESRGRRDGERTDQDQDHGGRGRNGSHAPDQPVRRGFAGALADAGAVNLGRNGTNATRTAESVRRAG